MSKYWVAAISPRTVLDFFQSSTLLKSLIALIFGAVYARLSNTAKNNFKRRQPSGKVYKFRRVNVYVITLVTHIVRAELQQNMIIRAIGAIKDFLMETIPDDRGDPKVP